MPQGSNSTGLQEVRGEEGRVQFGGVAKKGREKGGESRGTAADVVVGAGGAGVADCGQHGFVGKVGDGGG